MKLCGLLCFILLEPSRGKRRSSTFEKKRKKDKARYTFITSLLSTLRIVGVPDTKLLNGFTEKLTELGKRPMVGLGRQPTVQRHDSKDMIPKT